MYCRLEKFLQTIAVLEGDETIPSGTRVDPGAILLKKWSVRNVGDVPWASKTVVSGSSVYLFVIVVCLSLYCLLAGPWHGTPPLSLSSVFLFISTCECVIKSSNIPSL